MIAGNPAALEQKFQISGVLGPWIGNLSGGGERLRLRDGTGGLVDQVDYGSDSLPTVGIPWILHRIDPSGSRQRARRKLARFGFGERRDDGGAAF